MKAYKYKKWCFLLLIINTGLVFPQAKKLDKTYDTSGDVKINIDAQNTNIIVENWDKNQVKIIATLDADKKEDSQKMLNSWNLTTSGNQNEVRINSGSGDIPFPDMDMTALNESMGKLGDLIAPIMNDMVAPMVKNLASNPLPPDFYAKMGEMNFDYEAYKKDGDTYMKKWEAKVKANFGDDFHASMEKWAKQFEKNSAVWAKDSAQWKKDYELKMKDWGENFGKDMEKWGEQFGKQMEAWGAQFEEAQTQKADAGKNTAMAKMENLRKANKTIRINVPKNSRLILNVRYGEVKLKGTTHNLKANLSHSNFSASKISGENTQVHAEYTPLKIENWNYGVLNTSFVEDCSIQAIKSIKLISNSSEVHLGEITETGILSGNFAELTIGKLAPNFKRVDIKLTNSDLNLSLPKTALNFSYNGTQSEIAYPESVGIKSSTSYDNQTVNGYYLAKDANASVNINASFSDITIK